MNISIQYFNPLIPCREIPKHVFERHLLPDISIHSSHEGRYSNTAQKSVIIFLQYYQKFSCFSHLLPQKIKYLRTNRRKQPISSANPPRFSCELPVRTRMAFAIHSHLPRSYHITSFINDTFTIQKRF